MPETDATSRLDTDRLRVLADRSLAVIQAGQSPTGAYVASPTFPVYQYCWFRDGSFIADAMSRAGEIASAEAFFGWCATALVSRRDQVESLLARHGRGDQIPAADFLHTRFTLEGRESQEAWENFQLDGYGAWLWALDQHCRRHGRPLAPFLEGALLSARYVAAFATQPSYDWWEEHAVQRHTSTLAAIHAGLRALASWPDVAPDERAVADRVAVELASLVRTDGARLGHLAKWLGGNTVDASLIAVATPFEMLEVDDPLMTATIDRIESDLVDDGGVHRYTLDTFYGGGQWLLLAALLGWHELRRGRPDVARNQLDWIARHATAEGDLPEQVNDHLLAPAEEAAWVQRWGPVATPLLWSHAMFLTLALELGVVAPRSDDSLERPSRLPVRAP
jgi:GH15 family glucan-1,4-alpha-glucosidase